MKNDYAGITKNPQKISVALKATEKIDVKYTSIFLIVDFADKSEMWHKRGMDRNLDGSTK